MGDNASSKLFKSINGKLIELKKTNTIDSLGYFYGSHEITSFTPHKHEGKVLGLAAMHHQEKQSVKLIKFLLSNKKLKILRV